MTGMVAYGARCTWWDSKNLVSTKPSGLPCCPFCGGALFEADEGSWWQGARERDAEMVAKLGVRGSYVEFLEWARGKCFPDSTSAVAAFNSSQDPADRDDPPGVYPSVGVRPPQITNFNVESATLHSKSRGWLPAVTVTVLTDDGAGVTGTIVVGDELVQIVEDLSIAMERAVADVKAGRANGTLS